MGFALRARSARTLPAVLSPANAILLAILFGLCSGYLDIAIMLAKKAFMNSEGSLRNARDFAWMVPLGHATLVLVPALLVAAINRRWAPGVSWRIAAWAFAALALWIALLRAPFYSWCSLLLAVGLGRVIGDWVAALAPEGRPRKLRLALVAMLCVLGLSAGLTSGRDFYRERKAIAELSTPPANAKNVLMIVWDTVRAHNVGPYGYTRDTTPNLSRWANEGILFSQTMAPAPWTFPSHASFFTGQWPFRLNTQWRFALDGEKPTLAEYLASRGYQTAGFVGNTNCCTYETGLERGFQHFADYALTPRSLLTRTVPGKWLLETIARYVDPYECKWIGLQSRGAKDVNAELLQWLGRRRPDRPFFAFLNLFDAHEPYIPPPEFVGKFGVRPETQAQFQKLFDYVGSVKGEVVLRDHMMARDSYDSCIAYLDQQLGSLLDDLRRQGLLENTEVIVTSDHGEAFGEHGTFGHSYTVFQEEINVPLVILSRERPNRHAVFSPVSLRDLPATVVDLLGLSEGSPFPGHSLAEYWRLPAGQPTPEITSPVLTEESSQVAMGLARRESTAEATFQFSLVSSSHQYIRAEGGIELLFDLRTDPLGTINVLAKGENQELGLKYRRMLLKALTENPGSEEVERAYLTSFRQSLSKAVPDEKPEQVASGFVAGSPRSQ